MTTGLQQVMERERQRQKRLIGTLVTQEIAARQDELYRVADFLMTPEGNLDGLSEYIYRRCQELDHERPGDA